MLINRRRVVEVITKEIRYMLGVMFLVASFLLFILSFFTWQYWYWFYYEIATLVAAIIAFCLVRDFPRYSGRYLKLTIAFGVPSSLALITVALLTRKIPPIICISYSLVWLVTILDARFHFLSPFFYETAHITRLTMKDTIRDAFRKKPKIPLGRVYGEEEERDRLKRESKK